MVNWKACRKAAGLTQQQVTEFMYHNGFIWHQSTLYKIENGKRDVEFREGLTLCHILGIKFQDIKLPVNDSYIVI